MSRDCFITEQKDISPDFVGRNTWKIIKFLYWWFSFYSCGKQCKSHHNKCETEYYSNGRTARTIYEKTLVKLKRRVIHNDYDDPSMTKTILKEDLLSEQECMALVTTGWNNGGDTKWQMIIFDRLHLFSGDLIHSAVSFQLVKQ